MARASLPSRDDIKPDRRAINHGSPITSDAELLTFCELDDVLSLMTIAGQ
jgi:hypothetical protein